MTIALEFFLLYLCHMFIKTADKKDRHTGKIYRYHKLCESYHIGNKTRHRTVLVLGETGRDTKRPGEENAVPGERGYREAPFGHEQ